MLLLLIKLSFSLRISQYEKTLDNMPVNIAEDNPAWNLLMQKLKASKEIKKSAMKKKDNDSLPLRRSVRNEEKGAP